MKRWKDVPHVLLIYLLISSLGSPKKITMLEAWRGSLARGPGWVKTSPAAIRTNLALPSGLKEKRIVNLRRRHRGYLEAPTVDLSMYFLCGRPPRRTAYLVTLWVNLFCRH